MTFAQALRSARKEKHMTQQQLANAVGLHVMTIRRYESDTIGVSRVPRLNSIKRIADVLDISAIDLIDTAYLIRKEDIV